MVIYPTLHATSTHHSWISRRLAEVLCAALSREQGEPPGLVRSLVGPGLLSVMLTPRYVDWLLTNAARE